MIGSARTSNYAAPVRSTAVFDMVPAAVGMVGQVAADAGDDASRRLSMVIVALVVLAAVIAVATIVFWRLTRPDRPTGAGAAPGPPPGAG